MGEDKGKSDNGDGITAALANRQESSIECSRRMKSRFGRCIGCVIVLQYLLWMM